MQSEINSALCPAPPGLEPFTLDPVEFAPLNFDFHPRAIHGWLQELGFHVERTLTVSHFRIGILKRTVPTGLLVFMDSILQWTGALVRMSPSIFLRARAADGFSQAAAGAFFKCPECGHAPLEEGRDQLTCPRCKRSWQTSDGIYDFRGSES
jgi:hypothetical protein